MSEVLSRLRLFVVAVLCLASLSRAQVTLVQQASQNTPTSGSCGSQPSSESKTLTVTPGNTLVLFWFQTTDAFRNVTGGGVQWRQAAYVSGNTEMGIYYGLNSTGGVQTITVNWANTPVNCAFSIAEFSGVPNPTVVATQRLQLLLPGETAAPGTASGKTGVPLTHVAGSTFNVIVNATDLNWNVIPTATPVVHLAPNELTATMPADTALVGGTATLPVRFKVSNTAATLVASEASPGLEGSAVTAAPVDGGSSTAVTGTLVTTSGPELLMAVSVHPVVTGATAGPSGGFNALTGVTSPGTTSVVQEAAWLEAMSPGAYSTSWLYPSNTKWTALIAAFGTPTRYGADGSTPIVITVGAASKLQVLLPGETAAPGTTTGKTGTPNGQGQGVPFTVVVNLVDANWNVVSSTDVVSLTSTDSTAALPANGPLVAGTTTRTVTLNTAGSQTLTVSDVTNVARTANTSAAITVGAAFAASGVVSPAALGVGTSVALTGTATVTSTADALGAFRFPTLLAGSYTVTPSKPGHSFSPTSRAFTVTNVDVAALDFAITVDDAGIPDAGTLDAGAVDAGLADAGTLDAGTPDAGLTDAGFVDAGVPDAGTVDAGLPETPMEAHLSVGCGCQTGSPWGLSLLLIPVLTRRRR